MTRDAFKTIVIDTVTEGLRIPSKPNDRALNTIIDNTKRWFHQNDDEATEFEYIVISYKNFSTPLFKARRQVKLADNVMAITELKNLGSRFAFGQVGGSSRGDTGFNRAMMIAGNSDNMLYAITANMYQDFIRQNFVLSTVSFDYNRHSKMLVIEGSDPSDDLIAYGEVKLCEEDMFENERFHRYVIGECKKSFASVFGLVKVKTIGGLEINTNDFKSDGKDMITEVKKDIEGDKSADFLKLM